MVLPESERHAAITKADKMISLNPNCIVAIGKYGMVLEDEHDNHLIITASFVAYETKEERKALKKKAMRNLCSITDLGE